MDNVVDTKLEEQMKELATYIVDSAPPDVVKTFSIDFLIKSFTDAPDTFETAWIEYQAQQQNSNLIQFPARGKHNVI